jgi:hypothetical protein
MNQATQASSHRKGFIRNRALIPLSALVTAGALIAGWLVFGPQRENGVKATVIKTAEPSTARDAMQPPAPEPRATTGIAPDPRFKRRTPPSVPVALSPEAHHMVLAIQNKYTCAHCCEEETTPQCLPGLDGSASGDPQALIAALRQSLGALPDDCYVSTALPKVVDPKTPAEPMDILFEDLLKRPNPIKLRMLFIIAGIEDHPLADKALENLQAAMNLDHKKDWLRWEQSVVQECSHEERGMRSDNCRVH